ncbi:D-ribose transporter ATP-binding protein [Endozoicomonas montiporae]|uniref:D-ribose transporter ATP-binding protein n=2 Tax=Endozoicomonas montiporae TaxID=1027273 RepID=A0A081MZ74_9GAMM|nr:sugar ABC transporter ATP-binding protein [Endozoicomonas montiporae]AMO54969.1 putative ribose/galactose/methyl galactoside import ATP-binding protein [Endozoicomonas montiporae CL-33]KEQ11497.1 D-ribose transporter ATP-binding protein [Endozoicomonas montiporae]
MSDALLIMKNISKRFPGVIALDQVDFDIRKGEVHALLGENGAGKSTLMKVLSGVHQKDDGEIFLDGQAVNVTDPLTAQHLGISIIHQEFNLCSDLTVAQNIFIGREHRKGWRLDEHSQNCAASEILQNLNLDIAPETLVNTLTVAQQQMVEIAKALSCNSRILIMDEPTAALTESEIESLFKVTKMLKNRGVGIVYISHRLEELAAIADRATVMRDGCYVGTVNYQDTSLDELISMMVGRDLDDIFPPHQSAVCDEVVLTVKDLCRKDVLSDVSFNLHRGEILGFSGLMGAGRTEVARAIFGADPVSSGQIIINGKRLSKHSIPDAIEAGIGYLTEDRKHEGLALGLSVEINTLLSNYSGYCNPAGIIDEKKSSEVASKLSKRLRIKTPDLQQLAGNLSGGNQQKIIIAKWLCKDTDVLIFDEPTRGIDVGAKYEIYELMYELVKQGKSIIMISSELPEVLALSDRIVVMRHGRITAELTREQANQKSIMKYAALES